MLITKDTRIIYRNDVGAEIEFSPFSVYLLEEFEEGVENNIVTNKTNLMHGENYVSNTLESRYMVLSGIIEKNSSTITLTNNLIRVLNPTLKGKLIYVDSIGNKEIECMPEGIPSVVSNGGLIRFEINLKANHPFWQNKEKTEYIALITPQLKFPLVIPKNRGMTFGTKKPASETEVENIGDVESGFRVVFKARGTVTNPKIFNKITGEHIKINYIMAKGDSIEVVNYPELKKITVNSLTNGFKYLDINSDFFSLSVGKNIVGYLADVNTVNLDVIVYYTPRYLGV